MTTKSIILALFLAAVCFNLGAADLVTVDCPTLLNVHSTIVALQNRNNTFQLSSISLNTYHIPALVMNACQTYPNTFGNNSLSSSSLCYLPYYYINK